MVNKSTICLPEKKITQIKSLATTTQHSSWGQNENLRLHFKIRNFAHGQTILVFVSVFFALALAVLRAK